MWEPSRTPVKTSKSQHLRHSCFALHLPSGGPQLPNPEAALTSGRIASCISSSSTVAFLHFQGSFDLHCNWAINSLLWVPGSATCTCLRGRPPGWREGAQLTLVLESRQKVGDVLVSSRPTPPPIRGVGVYSRIHVITNCFGCCQRDFQCVSAAFGKV